MDLSTYGNIEVKKDCKLYNDIDKKEGFCRGLNDLYCKRERCKFYKPKQEQKKK